MFVEDIVYRDYAYLKKLGNSYKLILCNEVRRKGFEQVNVSTQKDYLYRLKGSKYERFEIVKEIADFSSVNPPNEKVRDAPEDFKLQNNICRARNKILEYVLCNDFVFFVTLTLDPDKYDRTDLKKFVHDFSMFVSDYNRGKNNFGMKSSIKYLFIPEQHEDGCWHMHGFIMGLPYDRLELFDIHGDKPLPRYIVDKIKQGNLLYNFPTYEKRFGYNIFEPIRNKKASVLYMCKYLTKDLSMNVKELGNHLYYCSKGLKKAEIIKEGQFLDSSFEFDFTNEYGGQSFYDYLSDEAVEDLKEKIGGKPLVLDDYRRGYRVHDGWYQYHDPDTGEIFAPDYPEVIREMG